jgi:hypothetical protein
MVLASDLLFFLFSSYLLDTNTAPVFLSVFGAPYNCHVI